MPDPRHRLPAAAALLAALTLGGCSGEDLPVDAAPAVTSQPSTADPSPSTSQSAAGPAVVKVLSTGSAPRRAVLLDVAEGHTESSSLQLNASIDIAAMSRGPIELPITLPFTTTVTEVGPDQVGVELTYGRPVLGAGDLQKVLAAQFDGLEGSTARTVYSRSGVVISSELDLAATMPPMLGQIMDGFGAGVFAQAVAFPTEPVGVGARWQVTSESGVGEATTTTKSVYELVELSDDGYQVRLKVSQKSGALDTPLGKITHGSSAVRGTLTGSTGLVGASTTTAAGKARATGRAEGERYVTTVEMELSGSTR